MEILVTNPLQYSCLKNSMDREPWKATVLGLQRVRQNWAAKHIEDVIKDTDEEPDETYSGWDPEGSSAGASVSMELGCTTLTAYRPVDVFTNLAALWTPYFRTSMKASSHRHDQIPPQSLAPLLFQEDGEGRWGWKFQASNHGLVFLVTSPHPEAN